MDVSSNGFEVNNNETVPNQNDNAEDYLELGGGDIHDLLEEGNIQVIF